MSESDNILVSEHDFTMKKRFILRDFIKLYESYPCLWNVKTKEYHNRFIRIQAYKVLAQKLSQIQPGADHASVVKKINCLRSNVRKEKAKTQRFLKSGVVYRTKLWYYHLFDFLYQMGEQRCANPPVTEVTLKMEEEKLSDPLDCEIEEYQFQNLSNCAVTDEMEQAIVEEVQNVTVQPSSSRNLKETQSYRREDRHDVFGKNVAMKLRYISTENDKQRLMAEKIINEALFMAEMGVLTLDHIEKLKTYC